MAVREKCSSGDPNRSCGGHKEAGYGAKCFSYSPTKDFPNLESWFESFPHLYFIFEENATIPLYPRDYLYLDDNRYCMGFDYLDSRIILGGIFMRNYDILFDRKNKKVEMVRANCNPKEFSNFANYYRNHTDDPADFNQPEEPLSPLVFFIFYLMSCILLLLLLCLTMYWRLFVKRFHLQSSVNSQKIELPSNSIEENIRETHEISQSDDC